MRPAWFVEVNVGVDHAGENVQIARIDDGAAGGGQIRPDGGDSSMDDADVGTPHCAGGDQRSAAHDEVQLVQREAR